VAVLQYAAHSDPENPHLSTHLKLSL